MHSPRTLTPRNQGKIKSKRSDQSVAVVESLTKEQQLERFIKFAAQCYIRSGVRLIPFDPLYNYQVELARIYLEYERTQVIKVRQLGVTETTSCFMLDHARSDEAYAGVTFSLTEKDAYKVSQRVERMPSRISGFQWSIDSLGLRRVKHGGELNYRASTKMGARGLESIHHIFMDETGFQPLAADIYAASAPAQEMVGKYAKTFMASTIPPEGIEDWFISQVAADMPDGYELEDMLAVARAAKYLNLTRGASKTPIPGFVAWEDKAGTAKVAIAHHAHPVYGANPNYLQEQKVKKKLTQDQVDREYGLRLPRTGGSLFNADAIENGAIGEWAGPYEDEWRKGHYLIGIDPNMGGEDSWVAQVWRIDTHPFQLVAEYAENLMLPSYCTAKTLRLIDEYRPVICAIEKNNGGLPISEAIIKARPWLRVELVNTTSTSKILNTDRIAIALTSGDVIYPPDWSGIGEMKRFSKADRKAIGTGHDDKVMAWSVAFAWLEEALTLVPRYGRGDTVSTGEMRDTYKAIEGF